MSEPVPIYKASGDARHMSAEAMLEEAREAIGERVPRYALVILAHREGDALEIDIHGSGVDMVTACGLLELAKSELLGGA